MAVAAGILLLAGGAYLAAQTHKESQSLIDAERIRAHVKFLSSDLLEGRGMGQRGSEIAAEYIATQFALDGLKPAGDHGTYFRKCPWWASPRFPRRSFARARHRPAAAA